MVYRSRNGPVPAEVWATWPDPHRLVRWARGVATPRKTLLLACAVVRHGYGRPTTDLGWLVLEAIEGLARGPVPPGGLIADHLRPRFPGTFRADPPDLTDAGRRELGADAGWFWPFARYAGTPDRPDPALLNAAIQGALKAASDGAFRDAEREVAAVGQVRRERGPPGPLRRLLGLSGVLVPLSREEQCRAVLGRIPAEDRPGWAGGADLWRATRALAGYLGKQRARAAQETLAGLVRCAFGDPFRPWAPEPDWVAEGGAVRRLAEHVDAAGDWSALPVLADALEDAGCTDEAPLAHCRGGGVHAAGCWVVDAVLRR